MGPTEIRTRQWSIACWTLLVVVFSFTYRFLSFELTDDDYIFFTLGRQIAVFDEWPVRDLREEGDPLHNVISAALQGTFGYSLAGEVLFDLAMLSAAAALVFVLAADVSGSIALALLAAVLAVLASPRLYDYVKAILPMFAFWLCVKYVDRPSRATAIAMGLFTAIAFLCRHDFGIFIGAASVAALAGAQVSRRSFQAAPLGAYAGAAVAGVLPFMVFVQLHGGVLSYVSTAQRYVDREVSRADDPRPTFAFDTSRPLWQRNPGIDVNIRWADRVSDETRVSLERRYRLLNGRQDEGRTWKYVLADPATENLRAIVADPHIEDTANIDRSITPSPERSLRHRVSSFLQSPPAVAVAPGILTRNNAVAWLYYLLRILPFLAAIALVAKIFGRQSMPDGWTKVVPIIVFCLIAPPLLLRGNMYENSRLADLTYPSAVLGAWMLAMAFESGRFAGLRRHAASEAAKRRSSTSNSTTPNSQSKLFRSSLLGSWIVGRWELSDSFRRLFHNRIFGAASGAIAIVALLFTCASIVAFAQVVETVGRVSVIVEPAALAETVRRRVEDLTASPPPVHWLSDATGMRGAAEYLRTCTRPEDRILVYGFYPELLFFSGRASAVDRAVLWAAYWNSPTDQRRTLSAMKQAPMALALIDATPADGTSTAGAFAQSFPMIAQHLRERYRLVATSAFGASTGLAFDVWADATRAAVRVYEPFSLPCFR